MKREKTIVRLLAAVIGSASLFSSAGALEVDRIAGEKSSVSGGAIESRSLDSIKKANECLLIPQTGKLDDAPSPARDSSPVSVGTGEAKTRQPRVLESGVVWANYDNGLGWHIDQLLETALRNSSETEKLEKSVKHFRGPVQRVLAQAKDGVQFVIPYQGFGPSSEAADIVLDEKLKLKSRAAAEYARQQQIDKLHLQITSSMMQIAMGLGERGTDNGKQVLNSGVSKLKTLVGDEQADQTVRLLTGWVETVHVPESLFQKKHWDVEEQNAVHTQVLHDALDNDQVVKGIVTALHKYNHRSKFARASGHAVETALGVASLSPNFVGPAAQVALTTFILATGGSEEAKILKELYLNKRFESRSRTLSEEAHLALNNYQLAKFTHNPVLLAFAEQWVEHFAGEKSARQVFIPTVTLVESATKAEVSTGK